MFELASGESPLTLLPPLFFLLRLYTKEAVDVPSLSKRIPIFFATSSLMIDACSGLLFIDGWTEVLPVSAYERLDPFVSLDLTPFLS